MSSSDEHIRAGGSPPLSSVAGSEPPPLLGLHRWRDREVLALALLALAAGFGQFGAVAALGDVAKGFGQVTHGTTIADQAGLSGTELGLGLAVIRLASLFALPVAGMADRLGRAKMLLGAVSLGLALTALAALSPTYWFFVVIFACGRPQLSATTALTQVSAAEQTASGDRAKAVALVAAGYGIGAGLVAIAHSLGLGVLGFRGLFALALLPLGVVMAIRRWVTEPDRFAVAAASPGHPLPVLGAVGRPFRRRLGVVALISFAISVITGPANSFVFLYAENIVHQRGGATAAMVVGAGATGLIGLLAGRWLADHWGRRATGALGMAGVAAFGVLAYVGGQGALVSGYVVGVLAGSVLAPALGSLVNELFPTSVRASVAGWTLAAGVLGAVVGLVSFGALADVGNRFGFAALVVFIPSAAVAGTFWLLPETKGREPEELWQPV
jgi:MFS family permease